MSSQAPKHSEAAKSRREVSTPSVSPPVLGEKKCLDAFIYGLIRTPARSEDASSVRVSLPKTGEGSGGVDVEEPLFAGASKLGSFRGGLTSKGAFSRLLPMMFAALIVLTTVLFAVSTSWCAPPGDKDRVAGVAYNKEVTEITKQLAETFPLMALIELQVIEILLESSADVGFFYQLISNEPGQEGQIGRIRESDIDFRVLSTGDAGLVMTGVFK